VGGEFFGGDDLAQRIVDGENIGLGSSQHDITWYMHFVVFVFETFISFAMTEGGLMIYVGTQSGYLLRVDVTRQDERKYSTSVTIVRKVCSCSE